MEAKKHFEKHFSKLKSEALTYSFLAALIVGFAVGFVAAVVTWFTDLNGLWISLAALIAATAVATPIFYIKKYRPTAINSARRMDRLGLEERLVTMVEYDGDASLMAQMQRQDARKKLEELETADLRMKIAKKTLVTLIASGVCSLAMIVVTGLSAYGLLPDGWAVLDTLTPDEPIKYVSVTYEVEDGGYIEGEADQLIPVGSNTSQVVAIAEDGYEFQGWDDGHSKPVRADGKVTEDVVYIAIFMPLDGEPQDSDDAQEEKPQDQPQNEGQSQQNPDPNSPPTNNGGGKYEEANQVIDGETYYKEVIDAYREMLKERLATEGDRMSEEERAIIEAYLGIV